MTLKPPPELTLPERFPWQDMAVVIRQLGEVTGLLKQYLAAPPPGLPGAPPAIAADGRVGALISRMDALTAAILGLPPGAPPVSVRVALEAGILHRGKASGGSPTTISQRGQFWETNMWRGFEAMVVEGKGTPQSRIVASNDMDTLTVPAWDEAPDHTSVYIIRSERIRTRTPEATGTGETTDLYADILDWDTRWHPGNKTIILENTDGSNSLNHRTLVRGEYASGGEATRFGAATLAVGDFAILMLTRPYARVKVQVQSASAGNPAGYRISRVAVP